MRKSKREMRILAGVFFFTFAVGLLVFLIAERIEYDAQQRQVQAVTQMYGEQLGYAAQYQARKLQMVTAMLRIEPKEFGWFSRAAEELRDKPDVLSLQLWQNGRLIAGQSADGAVDAERWQQAFSAAREAALHTDEPVLYGPVELRDGSAGFLGIQAVYIYQKDKSVFNVWGLNTILLRASAVLDQVNLEALPRQGLAYRLSSLGTDVTIAEGGTLSGSPVQAKIQAAGTDWILEVTPQNGWLNRSGLAAEAVLAFLAALLVTGMVWQFFQLQYQGEKMRLQATTDPLTNLSNRHILMEELKERCKDKKGHFLVCYMDLDGFKQVNDTHGHEVGDWLIQAAAQRVLDCLKPEDELFRLGGDEFVAILEEEPGSGWKQRLDEVEKQLRSMFIYPEAEEEICIEISVSVGCTIYPQTSRTPEGLLREADQRMFETKERYSTSRR